MKLTGKQKSFLRSLAMTKKPVFHLGKEGVTPTLAQSVEDYVLKNELVKIHLLDTCPLDVEAAAGEFIALGLELVQTIGKTIVLYRRNPKLESGIELPR
jgi:RNA-binding protein